MDYVVQYLELRSKFRGLTSLKRGDVVFFIPNSISSLERIVHRIFDGKRLIALFRHNEGNYAPPEFPLIDEFPLTYWRGMLPNERSGGSGFIPYSKFSQLGEPTYFPEECISREPIRVSDTGSRSKVLMVEQLSKRIGGISLIGLKHQLWLRNPEFLWLTSDLCHHNSKYIYSYQHEYMLIRIYV